MNSTEITEPTVGEVTFRRIYNTLRELMFDCMQSSFDRFDDYLSEQI